jgi:hypothetical protein
MSVTTVYLPWYADEEEIKELEESGVRVKLTAAWPRVGVQRVSDNEQLPDSAA